MTPFEIINKVRNDLFVNSLTLPKREELYGSEDQYLYDADLINPYSEYEEDVYQRAIHIRIVGYAYDDCAEETYDEETGEYNVQDFGCYPTMWFCTIYDDACAEFNAAHTSPGKAFAAALNKMKNSGFRLEHIVRLHQYSIGC